MSGSNDELEREELFEDRLLLEVLDGLQDAEGGDAATEIEERLRALTRDHLETLGALPHALEPLAPRPAVKEAVMAHARAGAGRGGAPESLSFPQLPARRRASRAAARWALPLAAVLAVTLLGLSAWQFAQLGDQRRQLDRLAGEIEAMGVARGELEAAHGALAESRTRLAMATTPGAEYCVLKPTGDAGGVGAAAHGTLVVAPDRGSWYLRIEGLEPCPRGGVYRLWFLTEGGAVPGASFDVEAAGTGVELSAREVPAGFHAVSVTLEPSGDGEEPAGPRVLFADEAMRLL